MIFCICGIFSLCSTYSCKCYLIGLFCFSYQCCRGVFMRHCEDPPVAIRASCCPVRWFVHRHPAGVCGGHKKKVPRDPHSRKPDRPASYLQLCPSDAMATHYIHPSLHPNAFVFLNAPPIRKKRSAHCGNLKRRRN